MDLPRLFQGRTTKTLDLAHLEQETGVPKITPTTWVVNGVRNRPYNAPEPHVLGQPMPATKAPSHKDRPAAKPAPAHAPAPAAKTPAAKAPAAKAPAKPAAPAAKPAVQPTRGTTPMTPPSVNGDAAAQVMLRFQDLMARFLETQQSVMTRYLQGGDGHLPANGALVHALEASLSSNGEGHEGNGDVHADHASNGEAVNGEAVNGEAVNGEVSHRSDAAKQESTNDEAAHTNGAAPVMDRAWVSAQLMDLVSKRTGYPKEMLGLDLDLEADLGVDSIKRVEILGTLAESMGGGDNSMAEQIDMEKLTGLKTLRAILDYLEPILSKPKGTAAQEEAATKTNNGKPQEQQFDVQRALVQVVDAPLPSSSSLVLPRGTVLFTDDGRGIARAAAGRLAEFGIRAVFLRMPGDKPKDSNSYVADLGDPKSVAELIKQLRQEVGPIAGLVHLLPLEAPPVAEECRLRMQRDVKSLYLLCRGLEQDLRQAGNEGGAILLAASGLGGTLGFGTGPALRDEGPGKGVAFYPGHGGVIGFTKCVAYEWPEVLVRVIDVDGTRPAADIADRMLGELADADGPLEVGYQGNRRVTWEPMAAPLVADDKAPAVLDSSATVLITGGARGITARVAVELARRYRPNLVLAGRSPLPEGDEEAETASLTAAGDIKAVLIQRLEREGRAVAPALIEAAYQRLMHEREIRATLADIKNAGGRVSYHQIDVRDEKAMTELLQEIAKKHGGLTGVIHGAGIIDDKLIRDKTPESFDRVFGTKTESAFLLGRLLDPAKLKFLVFFSSIASRYGNKGQSDYAAANEVLSKLALDLDRRWPARVVSIAWGPWSGTGMVAHLERHLSQRGLKMIAPEEGPRFVVEELLYGKKGDGEIIIAGGGANVVRPARRQAKPVKV